MSKTVRKLEKHIKIVENVEIRSYDYLENSLQTMAHYAMIYLSHAASYGRTWGNLH